MTRKLISASLLALVSTVTAWSQPSNKTAPQVVAGVALGFEFVTTLTLQNSLNGVFCSGTILLHQGSGQTPPTDLLVNGQAMSNPFMYNVAPGTFQRFEITTNAGVFQGAATIADFCGNLRITAGYDIVSFQGGSSVPQAGAGATNEIFIYDVPSGALLPGQIGRSPVDIDLAGADGTANIPGIAVVGDPLQPLPPGLQLCHQVRDNQGNLATGTVCNDVTGEHQTFNINDLFPGIPLLEDATWEFFVQGPGVRQDPNEGRQLDVLVIDVNLPNQFRAAPVVTENPNCPPNALCLEDNRFVVTVEANSGTVTAQGGPFPLDPDSGLFFFPQLGQDNFELLLNIINGCAFNDHYWVFYAATTDVEFRVSVTDTETNQTRDYDNILGNPAPPITDVSAFATCP